MPAQYQRNGQEMDPRHSNRLSLRQRFYLIEILGGLRLTGGRFFSNMWKHTQRMVGVKGVRGAVTI